MSELNLCSTSQNSDSCAGSAEAVAYWLREVEPDLGCSLGARRLGSILHLLELLHGCLHLRHLLGRHLHAHLSHGFLHGFGVELPVAHRSRRRVSSCA